MTSESPGPLRRSRGDGPRLSGLRIDTLIEYLDAEGPEGRKDQMQGGQDGRWRLTLAGQPIPV